MKSWKLIASVLILAVYMGIISYLSGLPDTMLKPETIFGLDIDPSIKHFVEFCALGILTTNVFWQLTGKTDFNRNFVTFSGSSAFSAFYGVLDEFHQSFVPTRYSTVFDVVVDVAGSLTGVFLFLTYMRLVKNRKIL